MSDKQYEIRQFKAGDSSARMVFEGGTGRLLGGVGRNWSRAFVFPFNTPQNRCVIQEYAFDHPFHNGIFVGQSDIYKDGQKNNFWVFPSNWNKAGNAVYDNLGTLEYNEETQVEEREGGYRFIYKILWQSEAGTPVFDEVREFDLYAGNDATMCEVKTTKIAAYGDIEFGKTKHGTIGVRVNPHLLPYLGGGMLAGSGGEIRRGGEEVVTDGPSEYVAYEADVHGLGAFGVCMSPIENSASDSLAGPWYSRHYGMSMFNPTMHESIPLKEGESWSCALRVVAYDGTLDSGRLAIWFSK